MTNSDNPALYKTLLATPETVTIRIRELAVDVVDRYASKKPLFVCLLRGGAPFAVQLMRDIASHDPQFHPEMDYMTVSTYANERTHRQPAAISNGLGAAYSGERPHGCVD